MNTISKEGKLCYLLGDLSVDFLKQDAHVATGTFIDIYNTSRVITNPTRVTKDTTTLTGYILTNNSNINLSIFQEFCVLRFQYAVFHIG